MFFGKNLLCSLATIYAQKTPQSLWEAKLTATGVIMTGIRLATVFLWMIFPKKSKMETILDFLDKKDPLSLSLWHVSSLKLEGPTLFHQTFSYKVWQLFKVGKLCFRGATPEENTWERWENIIKKRRLLAGTSNSFHKKWATEEFLNVVKLCT